MARLKITIPFGLKEWADQKIAEGRYASMSALVCDLLEEDAKLASRRVAINGSYGAVESTLKG